jgi:hypothetical protein
MNTSKATPENKKVYLETGEGKHLFATCTRKGNAQLIAAALNHYNPEALRLAGELADYVIYASEHTDQFRQSSGTVTLILEGKGHGGKRIKKACSDLRHAARKVHEAAGKARALRKALGGV